jgi:hypothetical protein|nr:MAG TPA: Receptor Binding Protein [Caudoviricetes sp.]
MAFTCGFFNSENGDRKYNAEQMSAIFDGIIADGVFTTIGDHMAVSAGTGMQVLVGTGKAWFDHTWNVNDAAYPLAIAASDVTLSRIDAIVLETNHSDSVRLNKLRVVQGTVASTPVKPTLTNSEKVHQHPLAWVTVSPGVTQIAASAIENAVGTSACPFVTGIIATTAIDDLFNQWNGEFDEWFDNLKAQLSDNVVANLQRQIDECKKGLTAKGTIIDSTTAQVLQLTEGSNVDDALLKLAMPEGKYALQITLLTPGGRPLPNIAITGLTTITGRAVSTDANGKAFGFATSNPATVTANLSKFLDLAANASKSFSLTSGIINQGVMTATRSSETQKLFTSSKSFYFSPDVAEYDWSAVGGGFSGGRGSYDSPTNMNRGSLSGGQGGDAGGVINQANVSYDGQAISCIVGSSGGGKSSVNGTQTPNGASGGAGGSMTLYELSEGTATTYNASDGAATTDSFLYPPTSVGGAGGGGGGHYESVQAYTYDASYGNGGSPGGGCGSNSQGTGPAYDGQQYGSGGGGGYTYVDEYRDTPDIALNYGGSGKQGAVGFMWRFKS